MLTIRDLHATVAGEPILRGLSLEVKAGEVHAIMGPNGSGKSTLARVVAGHPAFEVTGGEIEYEVNFRKKNLLEMEPWERAREGVFMAFQYPVELPGVNNETFLRTAFNEICRHQGVDELDEPGFRAFVLRKLDLVKMDPGFLERPVNEGFSGGEKKRNEILQMAVLNPRLALLDETDSGLDIDSLRTVADGVNTLRTKNNAIVLITHYQRLLDHIQPDHVHVLGNGRILRSGTRELALELEEKGYDWILNDAA